MKAFTKRSYFIFGILIALLVAGLIAGSFVDLKFSQSIADTSSVFGMICASFGELFGWGMTGVFGAMAFRLAKQSKKKIFKALLIIAGIVLIGSGAYLIFADMNSSHNGFKEVSHIAVRIVLTVLFQGGMTVGSFFIINTKDKKLLLTTWIILMIAFYLGLAINFITKGAIKRPRYYQIADGYDGYSALDLFENWYECGKVGLAESIIPNGDGLKSFPSGHSFVSMMSVLMFYVLLLNEKVKEKAWARELVLVGFILYALLIEFARILYGAHFLSDTSSGGLLAAVCAFIIPLIGFKIAEKKGWIFKKE